MDGMTDDLEALSRELRALAERVGALETTPAIDPDTFWALTGLQKRLPGDSDGAVMLVGSLTLPTGAPVAWQEGFDTAGLLETDWSEWATTLAALGHPVRLELLRHILSGVHTTAELAATESLGTTGQLHHHLRLLVAAGWVRHSGRGNYEVPAARVIPLLASIAGAQR